MSSQWYTIGVRVLMHDGITNRLTALSGIFAGLHHHAHLSQHNMDRFRQAIVGAGIAMAGSGLVRQMAQLVEHGREISRIRMQMGLQGWQSDTTDIAQHEARNISRRFPTISTAVALEMMKELTPIVGSRPEAIHMAEMLAPAYVQMQAVLGADRASTYHKQLTDLMRSAELLGISQNPQQMIAYMNATMQALAAFGGTVRPSDYFQAIKYARGAGLNWSPEFIQTVLPTIIQELGASSTGTAAMTAMSAVIGGRMHQRVYSRWVELGLADPSIQAPGNVTPEGRIRRMQPHMMPSRGQFMSDPNLWVQNTLVPALIRGGVITQAGYNEILQGNLTTGLGGETRQKIVENMTTLFGDRTAQGYFDLLTLQAFRISRDQRLVGQSRGPTSGPISPDIGLAATGLTTQWNELLTALANPNAAKAVEVLTLLTGVVSKMADVANHNPIVGQTVAAILGGLGAFFVTLGTVALTLAAVGAVGGGGMIVAVLAGIAGVITAVGAMNWEAISKSLPEMALRIQLAVTTMANQIGNAIVNALLAIPGMVAGAVSQMGSAIAGAIANALRLPILPPGSLPPSGPQPLGPQPQRMNWVPPGSGGQTIQANNTIMMDGHVVARQVAYHIVSGSENVNGPSTYDGIMGPTPVDLVAA